MLSDPGRWGEDGVFDPATVIGLQSHHSVLVLGNPAFLPWLNRENQNVSSARKLKEAVTLVMEHDFDRIIVGREFEFSHWAPLAVANVGLLAKQGTLAFFPRSEAEAWQVRQNIDFAFPTSRVWESNTTFGWVIQVELRGEHIDA